MPESLMKGKEAVSKSGNLGFTPRLNHSSLLVLTIEAHLDAVVETRRLVFQAVPEAIKS